MQHIILYESVDSTMFMHVSDCFKTQKMCDKAVDVNISKMLTFVSDYFKTQDICCF